MARAAATAVAVSAVRRSPRLRTAGTASAATVAVSPAPLAAPKRRGRPKKKPEATTTQDTSSAAAEEEGDAIKFPHGTLPRTFEEKKVAAGFKCVVGVDEAGRGPLAGPVVAAACHVPLDVHIPGVHDSKKLSEPQREALFAALTSHPRIRYAVHINSPQRIDEINILQASLESMTEAVMALSGPGPVADFVFVDGNRLPKQLTVEAEPVIKGDSKVFAIAAASIIAKVTRDRIMVEYDAQFPQYGLKQHKGYPTAAHMAAIALHGPCAIHRMTFAPLKPKEPKSKTKRPAKATKTTTIKKAKITKAKITSA